MALTCFRCLSLRVFSVVLSLSMLFLFWWMLGRPHAIAEPKVPADHKLQCVSYTPFVKSQSPYDLAKGLKIAPERLDYDLALLSRKFNCIRTYSVTGMELLPHYAEKYGMQLLLGIWINQDKKATQKEISQAVQIAHRYKNIIKGVIVGNETLLRREVTPSQLIHYISQVRKQINEIPVTYADVWEFWMLYPEVAPSVDTITIHILPYWENTPTSIDHAIAHVKKAQATVKTLFPDKPIFIGETGWPSQGRVREGAWPSRVNQARFIRGFVALAEKEEWSYNLIEAFDQPWKRLNEGAVGGYWGLYDKDRRDKGVFLGAVSNYPNWKTLFYLSGGFFLLAVVLLGILFHLDIKKWFLANSVLLIGLVSLVLQTQQFFFVIRNIGELIWALLILALAISSLGALLYLVITGSRVSPCSVYSLSQMVQEKRLKISWDVFLGILKFTTLFLAVMITLELVFDARYRSFQAYGFIMPALFFLVMSCFYLPREKENSDDFREEIIFGLALLGGAFFILFNETWLNWQSNLWVVVCSLLAYSFLNIPDFKFYFLNCEQYQKILKNVFLILVMTVTLALSIRYGLMESKAVSKICDQMPVPFWCSIRSFLGFLIHFQAFGRASLVLIICYFFRRSSWIMVAAFIMSLVGLTLYQVSVSVLAFMVSLMLIMRIFGTESIAIQIKKELK